MLWTWFHPYHWESRECTKYLFYGRCLCRWLLSLMSPYFFDWATIVPATPFFSSGGKNIFHGRKINLPREEPYLFSSFSSFSLSVVLDSGQPGRNRNRTGLSSLLGMFIPFAVNWYIVPEKYYIGTVLQVIWAYCWQQACNNSWNVPMLFRVSPYCRDVLNLIWH